MTLALPVCPRTALDTALDNFVATPRLDDIARTAETLLAPLIRPARKRP